MKNFRSFIIRISLAIMIVCSCGYFTRIFTGESRESTESSAEVTMALSSEPLNSLTFIAQSQGFFKQKGIALTRKVYPSGEKALQEMLKGEAELATVGETSIVFKSFEHRNFCIIATIGSSDNIARIIARKDSGISAPQDLAEKVIATMMNSEFHFFLHLFLLKYGLSDDRVSLEFRKPEELPGALAKGEVDAFCMRIPFICKAKQMLAEKEVIFSEPGLYTKRFNLVVRRDYLKQNPELIKDILQSYIQAEQFVIKNPSEAKRLFAMRLEVDESVVNDLWSDLDLEVVLDQGLILGMEEEARWFIDHENKKGPMPNFLDFICADALRSIRPPSVTIKDLGK